MIAGISICYIAYVIGLIEVTLFKGGVVFYTADTYTKK
jgi:hypothetical protein